MQNVNATQLSNLGVVLLQNLQQAQMSMLGVVSTPIAAIAAPESLTLIQQPPPVEPTPPPPPPTHPPPWCMHD